MGYNENILAIKRKNTVALCVIAAFQVIMLLVIRFLLGILVNELETGGFVFKLAIVFFAVCFILIDIYFYVKRVYRVKCLSGETPLKCVVEDLVIFSYADDHERSYKVYPIVKNTETGELMFTYDNYCLGSYNTRYSDINSKLVDARIYRRDSSAVEVGDIVYAYILKPVPVDVHIDENRNIVKLNRSKYKFLHENEKYGITVFNELHFFEGLIDVEYNGGERKNTT